MDKTDIKILKLLQTDAELTIQEISAAVHLSTTPCWKRINRLKANGYIKKTIALINPKLVNLDVTVFVQITMDSHDNDKLLLFGQVVADFEEIVECHRMSGTIDYLLKIVTCDIAGYDSFYKKLITEISFINVTANFVIETIKHTTALPLK